MIVLYVLRTEHYEYYGTSSIVKTYCRRSSIALDNIYVMISTKEHSSKYGVHKNLRLYFTCYCAAHDKEPSLPTRNKS
jgi:hypothetical protein